MKETIQVSTVSVTTLSVVTWANLDMALRCVLSALTIGWLLWKWWWAWKRRKEDNEKS